MPRTQRVVQYFQQLVDENQFQRDESDERPEDAMPRASTPEPRYAAWNPTSFAGYVPFSSPTIR